MSRKVVFVGVGGSGSKTLSFLKQSLQFRIEAAGGNPDRLPRAWQFIAVDLPPGEQQIRGVPQVLNGDSEYLGIAPDGKYYNMYDTELMNTDAVRDDFNRWRLAPMEVGQLPWLGAGQRRAVGRVATVSAVGKIRNRIASAQNVLSSADTNREFLDLPGPLKGDIGLEPIVVVVGSLTGGTGSGALLDVCRIIEAQLREDVMLLAYMPSVFDNLDPSDRSGMPGNTYFAMSELLNAIWDRSGDSSYLRRAGMDPFVSEMTGRGPAYPIAVGRGGGGAGSVSLNSDLQVYAAVAELLGELILDDSYSSSFEAEIVNVYSNPPITMTSPLFEGARMPFVSLGFSRFGLGRARFGRYCAERLTRAALHTIANGHLDLAGQDPATKAIADLPSENAGRALLDRDVQNAEHSETDSPATQLAKLCGVSEVGEGEGKDQVIESLYEQDQYLLAEAQLVSEVAGRTRMGSGQLSPTQWFERFRGELNLQGLETGTESFFMDELVKQMNVKAAEWAVKVPDKFREEITRILLSKGGWYTVALCDDLDKLLNEAVIDLRKEIEESTAQYDAYEPTARQTISSLRAKTVEFDHQTVRKATDVYLQGRLRKQFAVQRRSRAIALISTFQTSYLQRFRKELKETLQGMNRILDSDEYTNLSAEQPSVRLTTPPTEFLVLEADAYESTFDDLAGRVAGATADTRQRLLAMLFDDDRLDTNSLKRLRLVDFGDLGVLNDPNARPLVSLNVGVQHFLDRSYAWFAAESNALSNFINSDIVRYVEDPQITADERSDRIDSLVSVFSQALAAGRPLVDADPAVLQMATNAGGAGIGTTLSMSALPFAMDSEAGRAFAQALLGAGVDQAGLAGKFATPGVTVRTTDTINIASNSKALHPVCLVDYRRPVAERWTEEQAGGGGDFGTHRRTLRRAEAVPLPRESIVMLSTGWDVCRSLGMVKVDSASPDGATGPFRPSMLAAGAWMEFPDLSPEGPAGNKSEGFAIMMESFGLAQIVGALTPSPLASYEALFAIGRASTGRQPDGPLKEWLTTGQFPAGHEPELVPAEISGAADDVSSRQAALKSWLDGQKALQQTLSERSPLLDHSDRVHDFADLRITGLSRLVEALSGWAAVLASVDGGGRTASGSLAAD
jgi:hypothetical protein